MPLSGHAVQDESLFSILQLGTRVKLSTLIN